MFLTSTSSTRQIVACSSVFFLQRRLNPPRNSACRTSDFSLSFNLSHTFLHLSKDCCVCVYICSDTKSSWKYTQQEDTTVTVVPVYFNVFNVLQRTVAERSVGGRLSCTSLNLHVWGRDDTNTYSCLAGGALWLIWGNLAWFKKRKCLQYYKTSTVWLVWGRLQMTGCLSDVCVTWCLDRCAQGKSSPGTYTAKETSTWDFKRGLTLSFLLWLFLHTHFSITCISFFCVRS